ncbi:MAG: PrgI family protein [Candidatus Taylorbacteria bacterium]|nr:PrgI family protein [Candidatus Taylorbacteria bacterium]
MRFQVPQFINIEDKILGPFTIKQFIYLVGGGGMVYIVYHFLPFYIAIFIIAPIALFVLLLAFAKPNGKPFIFMVQAAIMYALSSRLYLWKRVPRKMTPSDAAKEFGNSAGAVPSLSNSKLKDLTWALDINQNVKNR